MENKRNVWLLPTDKPSILFKDDFDKYFISKNIDQEQNHFTPQNIYITSDEEIEEGDWYISNNSRVLIKYFQGSLIKNDKKIILTTEQYLIKYGIQSIDDEFLEWFVNNPSCDRIDFVLINDIEPWYKIIIPKKEPKPIHEQIIDAVGGEDRFRAIAGLKPKQETLEEAAFRMYPKSSIPRKLFIRGAKWQAERIYNSLSELRNELYDKLPTKDVDAFELLKIIKIHLQKLDNLCGSK